MSSYVAVQSRGVIALPPALRRRFLLDRPGAQVEVIEEADRIVLIPKAAIDASQTWYWTSRWQKMEREASEQLLNGEGAVYDTADDFLADLP